VNVVLVAEESAGIQVLRAVAASPHTIAGVLTAPPTRGGGATVATVAEGLGVPVLPSEGVKDPATADWIRSAQVDLLLNVHSLFLIRPEVVAAPRIGSFNLHPGPLPEYAGLNAPSWAIYHGERQHAVTLHWMEPEIDTGAIAYEARFPIAPDETGLSLSVRCVREGLPLIDRLLEDAGRDSGAIPAEPQDLSRRRYFGREVPREGKLAWDRPAREIVAFVRACDYFPFPSPWGHPVARVGADDLQIVKAAQTGDTADAPPGTVGAVADRAVRVASGDEWIAVSRVAMNGQVRNAAEVLEPGQQLADGG
jgi:UDP-4-amino-4-deoxy-L-arabinose formyltransferase/UDP-glucuronic acid dehydrogenase (UDP-4-keto-hexauronic acid decarboxylating)